MPITGTGGCYAGLSSDGKPTPPNAASLLIETDTDALFIWNGTGWVEKSSGPGGDAPDPPEGTYTPGSFTTTTGHYNLMVGRLTLTGAQRATLQGDARLRII